MTKPSSRLTSGNKGLVALHDKSFPLSSIVGTKVMKLVVMKPSSEKLSPTRGISSLSLTHSIVACGLEPFDWQAISADSPATKFPTGFAILNSFGLTVSGN